MEDKKIDINISSEIADGKYSNFAVVSHSECEFVVDFISIMPQMPEAKVVSRVVMAPEGAKKLLNALADNIRKYELAQSSKGIDTDGLMPIYSGPKGEA